MTRARVLLALGKTDPATVEFEVSYLDRTEPVRYKKLDQINFDNTRKIVILYPTGSRGMVYLGDGEWANRDRKKVR